MMFGSWGNPDRDECPGMGLRLDENETILDRIDETVPPGRTVNTGDGGDTPRPSGSASIREARPYCKGC